MADTQNSTNSDSNDNANQANQTDQAVASGNAYELIKKRLTEQGGRLEQQTATLNNARLEEFGSTQMQVIARTRIRTEYNCVAQDMVQVGDYLLFGYNVFMGLKRASNIKDVLSLYRLNEPVGNEEEYQLEEVDLKGTFLAQDAFVQDFNELYRYYKQTRLIQITVKDSKLLLAFQIGERITDIRVFRFALDFSQGTPESAQVAYVDNRGERDIELPPAYDFDWIETTRDQMVNGKYPHMNILDTIFVETVGGDLTIKIEDNTQSGQGIYSEPVNDRTQSLTDAEIAYAKVGSLILLKILPYREEDYRYFVYNTLTEAVLRLDAIGQSCVQLPEDHGIMFPGGYYLQTGEYKLFEANNVGATDLRFKRKIVSPNGEDVLFLFYDRDLGVTGLFPYNLIKKQLANPIYCNGMALAENGRLVLFSDQSEPSRIHPMQIWHTPYASHEYVSELPESTSFYGKIGNKELVRGISDLYSITRLIDNQSVSQKLYEELTNNTSRLFDSYYWLSEPELSEVASSIKEVTATAELVIDEFAKVQSIQKQTQTALADADTQQSEILRQIRVTSFESASDYVDQLSALRRQKGRLVSLKDLRYLDADKLQALQTQLEEAESELAEKTVLFLSGEEALSSYQGILVDVSERLNTAETNAELKPVLEKIDETAQGLDLLTELLGTLDVADATVRTQIIDDISTIYASLNQSKAKLNHKRKNLGSAEAVAQFGAQFKLFGQSIANALSIANTPEKSDEQMAKLLVQLEELESQFADPETNSGDQFLADIISKREEIYETFENHKQQLLDARNRKAQNLGDGALRMLESIKKRTQSTGVTGFTEEEALNTYFAADGLVQKVRNIAKELQAMGFSVKADDIDARLKAIQIESYKSLKDKSDLFEDGGQIIKLGKHRFSVNTQPLDLTLLSRQQSDGKRVLNLHLTGTDYYEVLNNTELNALRPYWDMNIASESDAVYRAEYLAYSIIESAKSSKEGLTEARLYQAYGATVITLDINGDIDNDSPLSKLVKAYATPRYQLGYDKGIHDHDATLLLMQILPTLREAGLLIYTPQVRALAQLFYWQLNIVQALGLDSLRQFGYDAWLNESVLTRASNWTDRAATAEQLRRALGSDTAKSLLVEDMSQVMRDFVAAYHDSSASVDNGVNIFKPSYVQLACEYLVSVMGQSAETNAGANSTINWQTSQQAQQLCEQLSQTLNSASGSMQATASFDQLQSSISKLGFQPKSAYELLATWFHALLEKTYGGNESANVAPDGTNETGEALSEEQLSEIEEQNALRKQQLESGRHYVPEAIAVLLTQLNDAQREALVQRLIDSGASFDKRMGVKRSGSTSASTTPSALSFSSITSSPVSSTTSLTSINNPLNQVQSFERSTGKVSLEIQINNLLGEHARIHQQTLTFAVDDFLNRLHHHDTQVIPAYRRYLAMRSEILHDSKETLRLDEFMPRPLSSFVRNRLINESYLPLIGDNLAKQMGTVGEDKRTDLMGILMMISPPGYGKTTLMEYVANRLGLIFMKINCPSLGHDVTSLDPEKAPNATAREELNKINLAFEMGNNVMLYLDDIQHTHAEFLQKFISLGDGTRRIDGVWQGKTKTYDMRGKKFCVVMAGNPYTESGEAFKVPDMLANRADIYNLGDIMSGMEEVFALSYIENSLTSNTVLAPLANRDLADVHRLIKMAKADNANLAQAQSGDLTYPYSTSEINEIVAILRHMFRVQEVILDVNQAYIASASQDDKYRVEPIFKLQGSYRNMNKMTEKLSAVMNEEELNQLIDDHYLGESQLLTQGAESNLLKLGEMRGVLTEAETERWAQIKADFLRNKAMGGEDGDTGARIVAQLVDLASGFNAISSQFETYLTKNDPEQIARLREAGQQAQLDAQINAQLEAQKILADSVINNAKVVSDSIDNGFEKSVSQLVQIYKHDHNAGKAEGEYLKQNQDVQKALMVQLVNAVEQLAQKMADSLSNSLTESLAKSDENQAADSDILDIHQQTALMATALKQALEPLTMRMDEKLAIDSSTDQSGKLIVNSLNRLNKIFDDYD
ncbi:DNA repair ATPase [Psychrobacter fozii]|uniref:ATPase family protein associated with various cellular activities (AAA) n=1 Tax=Psychrobacter fozii TaxID=198480 RepID=A0A2V4UNG0_9GAMM|nr:DNA repair ATPase [Psychrobacter fozii]PYE38076.1 ATPase family protein associated with various cellular activities (AAA) [Psychrobacter fozii]